MRTSGRAALMRCPSSLKPEVMLSFHLGAIAGQLRTIIGPWLEAKTPTSLDMVSGGDRPLPANHRGLPVPPEPPGRTMSVHLLLMRFQSGGCRCADLAHEIVLGHS